MKIFPVALLLLFFSIFNAYSSYDLYEKALNDNDAIYRRQKISFNEKEGRSLSEPIFLSKVDSKSITLLSKISFGEEFIHPSEPSEAEIKKLKEAHKIICSLDTPDVLAHQIKLRRKQVDAFQKEGKSEEEIESWIHWFTKRGEWGAIVNQTSKQQAEIFIQEIKQKTNQFLLRHTIVQNDCAIQGIVVVYPGTSAHILEESFYDQVYCPPLWAVGYLTYEIPFSTSKVFSSKLHIHYINVTESWQKKGHGYAIARYLSDFVTEHFWDIDYLTVSCRHSISARIFAKCGFKRLENNEEFHHDANYYRSARDIEGERGQEIMKAYMKSSMFLSNPKPDYKSWFNANYVKIFPNQYHKIGYSFF